MLHSGALFGAQRYGCRLRDLCGAMGVLEDAEGGYGVESCHTRVELGSRRAARARRGTTWIMLIGHVGYAPGVRLVKPRRLSARRVQRGST